MKTKFNYNGFELELNWYSDNDDDSSGYKGHGIIIEEVHLFGKDITKLLEPQINQLTSEFEKYLNSQNKSI